MAAGCIHGARCAHLATSRRRQPQASEWPMAYIVRTCRVGAADGSKSAGELESPGLSQIGPSTRSRTGARDGDVSRAGHDRPRRNRYTSNREHLDARRPSASLTRRRPQRRRFPEERRAGSRLDGTRDGGLYERTPCSQRRRLPRIAKESSAISLRWVSVQFRCDASISCYRNRGQHAT